MSNQRFSLRDYQQEAIQNVIRARIAGYNRLLVCLPTGAGKTVIFSELCRLARKDVLVLAHREELLGQAKEKIERMTEGKAVVDIEQDRMRLLQIAMWLLLRFVPSEQKDSID